MLGKRVKLARKNIENNAKVKTKFGALLQLVLICSALASCGSTPPNELTELPAQAFNPQSRYALLWIKPCGEKLVGGCVSDDGRTTEAKYVIHGSAGRVDLKQQYEDSVALSASIARINARPAMQTYFLKSLRRDLAARDLDVITVAEPLHEGFLKKTSSSRVLFENVGTDATQFPLQLKANTFDFNALYQRLGVDYLVVMELLRFSVEQHFGPTGQATENPKVVSAVRLYVHDRATNETVFNDYAHKVVLAKDDWDNPPLYKSLESSLMLTIKGAVEEAKANLLR